jgi:competence ComEA-like helix-hairpin-helix protein
MRFSYRAPAGFLAILVIAGPGLLQSGRFSGGEETPKTSRASRDCQQKVIDPIDISRASLEDFAKLPGIGPELARRIVAFREKHGPFRRVEDLLVIKGVGHKKWRAIRPYLRVGNEAAPRQVQEQTGTTRVTKD